MRTYLCLNKSSIDEKYFFRQIEVGLIKVIFSFGALSRNLYASPYNIIDNWAGWFRANSQPIGVSRANQITNSVTVKGRQPWIIYCRKPNACMQTSRRRNSWASSEPHRSSSLQYSFEQLGQNVRNSQEYASVYRLIRLCALSKSSTSSSDQCKLLPVLLGLFNHNINIFAIVIGLLCSSHLRSYGNLL